jgi:hypothetical protein
LICQNESKQRTSDVSESDSIAGAEIAAKKTKAHLTKGILGNATKHYLASHTIHVPLQTLYKRLEYITTETAGHLDNGSKYINIKSSKHYIRGWSISQQKQLGT